MGRPNFFLPVRILSRVFRGKFIALLKQAFRSGRLRSCGDPSRRGDVAAFERLLDRSVRTEWVVYAKPPFGGARQVLKYLARYTHRTAISNARLSAFDGERVSFQWKDYADDSRQKTMTLTAVEFTRRFLMHVLPRGFTRIRYFGYLANRHRREKLAAARQLLGCDAHGLPVELPPQPAAPAEPVDDQDAGARCSVCCAGRMQSIAALTPHAPPELRWLLPRTARFQRRPCSDTS